MRIISTNTAVPKTFIWNNAEVTTGIFKKPSHSPIYLSKNDVVNDEVSDRLHHGGYYKACYVYSSEQYPFWKDVYPDLEWTWGMFGENLTVADFDEHKVFVGDIYKVGSALVQISQHREPCFKLGYKFGDQKIIKQFIKHGRGGTYMSVLKEGEVTVGDEFSLVERSKVSMTVAALFNLFYSKEKDQDLLQIAANSKVLPLKKRNWFRSKLL